MKTQPRPPQMKLVEWTPGTFWIVSITGQDGSYTPLVRLDPADLPQVVKAVNAYEPMVEALKIALFYFEGQSAKGNYIDVPGGFNHDMSMEGLLGQALAKVEEA